MSAIGATDRLRGQSEVPPEIKGVSTAVGRDIAVSWAYGEFWRQAAERGCRVIGLPELTWVDRRTVRVEALVEFPDGVTSLDENERGVAS